MVRASLVLLLTLVLQAACSQAEIERNLDEIVAGAQRAYDDLAAAVDEVIDGLDGEARQAVEEARAAAEEARAAVGDARRGLEALADRVPEGVRDAFDRVVSSLGALAQEIRRALERG